MSTSSPLGNFDFSKFEFPKSLKCAKCSGEFSIPSERALRVYSCPNCAEPFSTKNSWQEGWTTFSTRFVDYKTKAPRLDFTPFEICDHVGSKTIKWTDVIGIEFRGSHQKLNHYRSTRYESFTQSAFYVVRLRDGSEVHLNIDNLNVPPSEILDIQFPVEVKGRPEPGTYTHVSAEAMGFILEDVKDFPTQIGLMILVAVIALSIVFALAR